MTEQVSFDDEELILVDENDEIIGYGDKYAVHVDTPQRHRAFSILIFNDKREILLQQRAPEKPLWAGYWSNTCCSHPRKGEDFEAATTRRLREEMGLSANMTYVYKFEYKVDFEDDTGYRGTEHEICRVFIGQTNDEPTPNRTEVSDWRYLSFEALNQEIQHVPERFTPWFKDEWSALTTEHQEELEIFFAAQ